MSSKPLLQAGGVSTFPFNAVPTLRQGNNGGLLDSPASLTNTLSRPPSMNSLSSVAGELNEARKEFVSFGAASNLCNAIIGAGILTLPYAFARVGMALGCCLMVFFAIQTVYVCNILRACCAFTGEVTYSGLGRFFFGRSVEVGIDMLLAVYAFASCIGYLTILGDETAVIFALLQENYHIHFSYAWMESRTFLLSALTGVCILPLCLLRSVKSLQYAAFLAVSSAIYISCIVFAQMPEFSDTCSLAETSMYNCVAGQCVVEPRSFQAQYANLKSCSEACEGATDLVSEPILADFGSGLWQSLPLFIYAFNCVVPFVPILIEMKRKRAVRVRTTLTFAVTVCFVAYCMCAFGGYLAFCGRSCPNILDCYPAGNALVLPARVALLINLIFIVPLFNFIVRSCIEKRVGLISDKDLAESSNPLLSVLLTFFLVWSSNALACIFKNLGVILGLTGAIGGSILVWVLPGLFLLKMLKMGGGKAALYGIPLEEAFHPEGSPSPTAPQSPNELSDKNDTPAVQFSPRGNDRKESLFRIAAYVLVVLGIVLLCLGTTVTLLGS